MVDSSSFFALVACCDLISGSWEMKPTRGFSSILGKFLSETMMMMISRDAHGEELQLGNCSVLWSTEIPLIFIECDCVVPRAFNLI